MPGGGLERRAAEPPRLGSPSAGLEGGATLTCLMAALKAPRMAAAPPQSRFIPGMVVCRQHKDWERGERLLTRPAKASVPTHSHTGPPRGSPRPQDSQPGGGPPGAPEGMAQAEGPLSRKGALGSTPQSRLGQRGRGTGWSCRRPVWRLPRSTAGGFRRAQSCGSPWAWDGDRFAHSYLAPEFHLSQSCCVYVGPGAEVGAGSPAASGPPVSGLGLVPPPCSCHMPLSLTAAGVQEAGQESTGPSPSWRQPHDNGVMTSGRSQRPCTSEHPIHLPWVTEQHTPLPPWPC